MRKWLVMLAVALFVSSCGAHKPMIFQSALDKFPIDATKNYLVWQYDSVGGDMATVFCRVQASGEFQDCRREDNNDNNRLNFKVFDGLLGSYRTFFKNNDEYFLISYAEATRTGKYAFVYGESEVSQPRRILRFGNSTFVGDFKPGTVTVIPYGWENRLSAAGIKRTVEAGLRQAFGPRADVLTVEVARKVPIDCTVKKLGFLKGTDTRCELK